MAEKVLKNPGRTLVEHVACAVASKIPKDVLPTLSKVINFYHTGKGLDS